jgi:hypothetical protein
MLYLIGTILFVRLPEQEAEMQKQTDNKISVCLGANQSRAGTLTIKCRHFFVDNKGVRI